MSAAPIGVGVIGLGRAFTLMLNTFQRDARVRLVAACDPYAAARVQFEKDFSGRTFETAEALCAEQNVELIYIASPHQFHAHHVAMAAAHGKHVLLEKPMAITLDDCTLAIDAMRAAGLTLIVGPSHSFDAPVLKAREIIDSGAVGDVRMIQALNYTDFLYRPRRPDELKTEEGGGVIHSQAAHQMDIIRLLGGGKLRTVRALTGQWDATRSTEGAYSALLRFDCGAFANMTYSGYGRFDSDEWMDGLGELGVVKAADAYGRARKRLSAIAASRENEASAKAARNYGGPAYVPAPLPTAHEHFGPIIVSCDRADLRLTPTGVWVCSDATRDFVSTPFTGVPRREVIDEVWALLREGASESASASARGRHDGAWARATTEACLAILTSARDDCDVALQWQVPWRR